VLNVGAGCCADVNAAASSGAENFAGDYKDMTCGGSNPTARIWTEFPGVVRLSQLGTGRPVYQSNGLADFDSGPDEVGAIGIAFLGSDMQPAYSNSKLFVWFDWQTFRDQYCSPCGPTVGQPSGVYANSILVRDIMDFLVVANETPTPTIDIKIKCEILIILKNIINIPIRNIIIAVPKSGCLITSKNGNKT
jgi:hypothetical protein